MAKIILDDNEDLEIIYKGYRFSIVISKLEDDQLPEFDMKLYKGDEEVDMCVNCWGEHLAPAEALSEQDQHVRLSRQICIPFGE